MNLAALRKRYAEIGTEIRTILEGAPEGVVNEEIASQIDGLKATRKGILASITERESLDAEDRANIRPVEQADAGAALPEAQRSSVRVGEDRAAARPFVSLGDQLLAIRRVHTPGQAQEDDEKRLNFLNAETRAATGMSVAVDADGGFAVAKDFVQEIMGPIRDIESGSVLSRVSNIPISSNSNGVKFNQVDETSRVNGSRWGGVQAYYADEADTVAASKPKLRQVSLELKKLFALYYMTDELTQDASALGALAGEAFTEEIRFKAEDSIINGPGGGRPLGIVAGGSLISVAIESGQNIANTAASIALNTAKMLSRFNGNRANAVWLYNTELFPKLAVATLGGSSVPVYLPGGNIASAPFGTLWGIPTLPIEYAAAEGTVGDIILADLSQYWHADKGGPQAAVSMHVRFIYGENTFRMTYRHDGQPKVRQPITPFKGSATKSPFVALAARS